METAEFVVDKVLALVKSPVPVAVMVTPLVPVTLALSVIAPFVAVLDRIACVPDRVLLAVRFPFAVIVSTPLVEVTAPLVPKLADAPVVTTVKLPPTEEAPRVRAPVLLTKAAPGLPVLIVIIEAAVKIGVPTVPIEPVVDASVMAGELPEVLVTVTLPVRVMLPLPLAVMKIVPPVLMLLLIAIDPLLVVKIETMPVP